jgi:hypothetical protein
LIKIGYEGDFPLTTLNIDKEDSTSYEKETQNNIPKYDLKQQFTPQNAMDIINVYPELSSLAKYVVPETIDYVGVTEPQIRKLDAVGQISEAYVRALEAGDNDAAQQYIDWINTKPYRRIELTPSQQARVKSITAVYKPKQLNKELFGGLVGFSDAATLGLFSLASRLSKFQGPSYEKMILPWNALDKATAKEAGTGRVIGEVFGSLLPFALGDMAIGSSFLVRELAGCPRIVVAAVRGAASMSMVQFVSDVAHGKDIISVISGIPSNLIIGGAAGAVIELGGGLFKALFRKIIGISNAGRAISELFTKGTMPKIGGIEISQSDVDFVKDYIRQLTKHGTNDPELRKVVDLVKRLADTADITVDDAINLLDKALVNAPDGALSRMANMTKEEFESLVKQGVETIKNNVPTLVKQAEVLIKGISNKSVEGEGNLLKTVTDIKSSKPRITETQLSNVTNIESSIIKVEKPFEIGQNSRISKLNANKITEAFKAKGYPLAPGDLVELKVVNGKAVEAQLLDGTRDIKQIPSGTDYRVLKYESVGYGSRNPSFIKATNTEITAAANLVEGEAGKAGGSIENISTAGAVGKAGISNAYISTPELEAHINNIDLSVPRRRGIGGAHNSEEFFKNDIKIVRAIPSKDIPGVTYYEYNMPLLGKEGKPIGGYGTTVFQQTVYDPSIFPTSEYMRRGLEAANDSFRTYGRLMRQWEGYDSMGVLWIGFEENGLPRTFFPDILME